MLISYYQKRYERDYLPKVAGFRDLQGAVDSYAKRADTYFQEMVMLSNQNRRHEKWLLQIAEKIGIKLEI